MGFDRHYNISGPIFTWLAHECRPEICKELVCRYLLPSPPLFFIINFSYLSALYTTIFKANLFLDILRTSETILQITHDFSRVKVVCINQLSNAFYDFGLQYSNRTFSNLTLTFYGIIS